jgi:hypothetical protein
MKLKLFSLLLLAGALSAGAQNYTNNIWTNQITGELSTNIAFQVSVYAGGALKIPPATITNHQGRPTNFFDANHDRMQAAIRTHGLSNVTLHTVTITNLNAPGTGTASQRLGANSIASSNNTTAIGFEANAAHDNATAIGASTTAVGEGSTALGSGASAGLYGGTSIGAGSEANGYLSSSFGPLATSAHTNSTSIGAGANTTADYQVRIGTDAETVNIPGRLEVEGGVSNLTVRGTNVLNGSLKLAAHTYASLVNGDNSNLELGTNALASLSGATTTANLHSFGLKESGRIVLVELTGATNYVVVNESGTEGTATRRIVTGTGGNLTLTNAPSYLWLLRGSTRWYVLGRPN